MSRQNPTVIIALGGNAISPKNESGNIEKQFEHRIENVCRQQYFSCKQKITLQTVLTHQQLLLIQ